MRADIHPDYKMTTISCTCGSIYETRSTSKDLKIGICASCHPFFTGEQRFIDTAGRVEKFASRYGDSQVRRKAPSLGNLPTPKREKPAKVEAEEAEAPAETATPAPTEAAAPAPAETPAPASEEAAS